MPIKTEELICKKCIYFSEKGSECRRSFPQIINPKTGQIFPDVDPDSWCGEGQWSVGVKGRNQKVGISQRVVISREYLYGNDVDFEWA